MLMLAHLLKYQTQIASTGSITGVTGTSVQVNCLEGYSGGGITTCGSNGSFAPLLSCNSSGLEEIQPPQMIVSDSINNTECTGPSGGNYDCTRNVRIHTFIRSSISGSNLTYQGDGSNVPLYAFPVFKVIEGSESCSSIDSSYTIGNTNYGIWNSSNGTYHFGGYNNTRLLERLYNTIN